MEHISATHASNQFGDVLLKSQREPVRVTKNGKPVAVILSETDYRELKIQALRAAIIEGEESGDDGIHNMDDIKAMAMKEAGLTD